MAIDRVRKHLEKWGRGNYIIELNESIATVELAAAALKCAPERIAKTISLKKGETAMVVVTAGDAKISNRKFRDEFAIKARMLPRDQTEDIIGHAAGGVCPFGLNSGIDVYMDVSLKRFETVYPACGSASSAIQLTPDELYEYSHCLKWVDVCEGWL
ncbi:MAG: YbaK/EbsC family protein [Christensenellales bacterium]|jgi:prolyl-tRNA editing enzyme YbaK/EbsC (Cys-tRNA(Pro) deacylase)